MVRSAKIVLDGNALMLFPVTPTVLRAAGRSLSYTRRKHLTTWAQQQANGGNKILFQEIQCYSVREINNVPAILTNAGYFLRLQKALKEEGLSVEVSDFSPEDESVFTPKWDAIADIKFRYKQRETIVKMASSRRGRVWWATGSGKGWVLPHFCRLMNRCRIVVTTKHLSVLDTNYNRLQSFLPNVGVYSSRNKKLGRRVMCYSSGCLLHAAKEFKPHIVIADEVHELATDKMFEMFNKFRHARMFCLSANDGDRFDGADFELEGIFGPIISSLSYEEAEKHGMVVPIHVHWHNVGGKDLVENSSGVAAARWGIWRNHTRNKLIADIANSYPANQVLITCQTLEHACFLKKLLPEFSLCYAPNDMHSESLDTYKAWGLVSGDEELMTLKKLRWLQKRFEDGKLRKVIATTVWNRGVSFDNLQVLIRADGSSDPINDTQIPGRLARTMEGKTHGILIDFMDKFNSRFLRRSQARKNDYARKKWVQHLPEQAASPLEDLMRGMT